MPALALACLVSVAAGARAQEKTSTSDGVYSRDQALRGQDVYLGQCRSCHTPESHTGEAFSAAWGGKPLAELFAFIHERMPKSEPGSLSPQEVADVLAYLLRINRMPQGADELPADSAVLRKIRFDVQKSPTSPP